MKVLIVSGGHLPIPAVQGGAVENLIEMYLEENEKKYHNKNIIYNLLYIFDIYIIYK